MKDSNSSQALVKGDMVKYSGNWVGSKFKHGIVIEGPFVMDFAFSVAGKEAEPEFVNVKWWKTDGTIRTQTDSIYNLVKVNE